MNAYRVIQTTTWHDFHDALNALGREGWNYSEDLQVVVYLGSLYYIGTMVKYDEPEVPHSPVDSISHSGPYPPGSR